MITKNGLTIKHNVRAMMYFERATEKNFTIRDQFDVVSYMYISARLYNADYNKTLDEFADEIDSEDIMKFCNEISDLAQTAKKKSNRLITMIKKITSRQ